MACESPRFGNQASVDQTGFSYAGILDPQSLAGMLAGAHRAGPQSHLTPPPVYSIPASYRVRVTTRSIATQMELEGLVSTFGIHLEVETRQNETWVARVLVSRQFANMFCNR